MKALLPIGITLLIGNLAFAKENIGTPKKNTNNQVNVHRAADCSAPTGQFDLSINNVRARIYNGGDMWWVFNDKGNIHTETGGEAIGLEVRAQAFAFSTNDEINNMTFYKYEVINKSSYDLNQKHFAQWVDSDIGNYGDDFVGCDVGRGLGYTYNGDALDEGANGYGINPPAIGLDFFEGPFLDADGMDNHHSENINDWDLKNQSNIPVASGVYIIHVDVPDVGEKVLKWFGVMRPIDLDTF